MRFTRSKEESKISCACYGLRLSSGREMNQPIRATPRRSDLT